MTAINISIGFPRSQRNTSSTGVSGASISGFTSAQIIGANQLFYFESDTVLTISGSELTDVSFDLIGGGGSGGYSHGGGGGAGEFVRRTAQTIPVGSYPIIIGQGGAARTSPGNGNDGTPSSFLGLIATGGGAGGAQGVDGMNGGSGGGGGRNASAGGNSTAADGIGNAGAAHDASAQQFSGGGGGAGAAATISANSAGEGVVSLDGNFVCGGGHGSVGSDPSQGRTVAQSSSTTGSDHHASNYGSGGGGGRYNYGGGSGGSGLLIISVPADQVSLA